MTNFGAVLKNTALKCIKVLASVTVFAACQTFSGVACVRDGQVCKRTFMAEVLW